MEDKFLSNIVLLIAAVIIVAVGLILEKKSREASMQDNETKAKRLLVTSNILCILGIVLTLSFTIILLVEETDPYALCSMR